MGYKWALTQGSLFSNFNANAVLATKFQFGSGGTSMHLWAPLTSSLCLWLTAIGSMTTAEHAQTLASTRYECDTVCQRLDRNGRQMAK